MMHRAATLLAAVAFMSAGCGQSGIEDPEASVLLAEVQVGQGGSICCGFWTEPVRGATCLAYDFELPVLGAGPPYVQATAILGCDRSFPHGTSGASVDFGPADPGFAGIVSRATDGVDQQITVLTLGVDAQLEATHPTGATSQVEFEAFYPDHTVMDGATVAFIRLVIDAIVARQTPLDETGNTNTVQVSGSWQFWGTPARR